MGDFGVKVVGESVMLAALRAEPIAEVKPWRRTMRPRLTPWNCSLLDEIGNPLQSGSRQHLITTEQLCSNRRSKHWVVVDILAPRAIHVDSAVTVSISGTTLMVTVKAPTSASSSSSGKKRQGQGSGGGILEARYEVELPRGVYPSKTSTKMSRALGMLSVSMVADVDSYETA